MFLEFTTKREKTMINIDKILFITLVKGEVLIEDIDGNQYYPTETYQEIINKLDVLCQFNNNK